VSQERRRHPRRGVDYPCWFSIDSNTSFIVGRVRDVSQGGARVACATHTQLPATVDLYMTENGKVGRRCKVVWNSQDEFGLMFLGPTAPLPPDAMASLDQNEVIAV
jgi:hypothetical protein